MSARKKNTKNMKLDGPYVYSVSVDAKKKQYTVKNEKGNTNFVAPVTIGFPKLYVFSLNRRLIYVGQTVQGMASRMRLGVNPKGKTGYHGYKWIEDYTDVKLHVWCVENCPEVKKQKMFNLESIEAEIVHLYRCNYGQWPKYQNEIHFHETEKIHRKLAREIFGYF